MVKGKGSQQVQFQDNANKNDFRTNVLTVEEWQLLFKLPLAIVPLVYRCSITVSVAEVVTV